MALYTAARLADIGCALEMATLIYDDQGCIALTKEPVLLLRIKHIDNEFHVLREKVHDGLFRD